MGRLNIWIDLDKPPGGCEMAMKLTGITLNDIQPKSLRFITFIYEQRGPIEAR